MAFQSELHFPLHSLVLALSALVGPLSIKLLLGSELRAGVSLGHGRHWSGTGESSWAFWDPELSHKVQASLAAFPSVCLSSWLGWIHTLTESREQVRLGCPSSHPEAATAWRCEDSG